MSEWVERRLQLYRQKQSEEKQRQFWQQKASAIYPAQFDALQEQIASDVNQYNEGYPLLHQCRATVHREVGKIAISTHEKHVIVSKADANVIQLKYILGTKETQEYLEVTSDTAGNVRYRQGERLLASHENASELILDRILC